jgi:8-oxo-dGTP pyrophosphatase MutT (NUDIX family)
VSGSFELLGERLVYQGNIWRVTVGTFRAPDGSTFERDVVRSPGAVGVVPLRFDVEGNPEVVLVRQYRPVLGTELLEIPAGMRDVAGEPPAETARRELAEECGLLAGRLELLTTFHNSAGMTDASTHVFLGLELESVPREAHGPEEEHMTVHALGLGAALAAVEAGEITDAKTVIGLLLTDRWLQRAAGR